jgi:hypothetical protein
MQLPKYVLKRSKNALRYHRRIKGTKEVFTRAMRSKQNSEASAIQREAADLTAQYEAELRYRQAASPDALSHGDLERAAAEHLRKLELRAGVLYDRNATEEEAGWNSVAADDAAGLDDFIDDLRDKEREGVGLEGLPESLRPERLTPWTAEEQKKFAVIQTAAEALRKPRRRPPRYLSQVMDWYAVNRKAKGKENWDTSSREYKRIHARFFKVLAVIGDRETEGLHVARAINDGLEEYVYQERERGGVKGQSVVRNLSETLSAFRRVSKVFKLGWVIETPEVDDSDVEERGVLMPKEMEAVLQHCLSKRDAPSAAILASIHAMIPTEVGRLEPDDMLLDGTQPYLRLLTGKTTLRRRIVPIVVGLDVMRESLPAAVAWIRSVKEPSATINNRLKRITGDERHTLYWLRHTFNDWATAAQIDVLSQAFIAGWSVAGREGRFSKRLTHYGAEGLEGDDRLLALTKAQRKVLKRLIDAEAALLGKQSNVVPLQR